MVNKKCVICGEEFQTSKGNQVCCSISCARKRKRITDRKITLVEINCAHCGEPFVPKRRDSKCCSQSCTEARKYQLGKENYVMGVSMAKCVICGREFARKSNAWARATCSTECLYELRKAGTKRKMADGQPQDNYIMPIDFSKLETYTHGYISFECPEFDPMTNRIGVYHEQNYHRL